jgi:hypothetical protein
MVSLTLLFRLDGQDLMGLATRRFIRYLFNWQMVDFDLQVSAAEYWQMGATNLQFTQYLALANGCYQFAAVRNNVLANGGYQFTGSSLPCCRKWCLVADVLQVILSKLIRFLVLQMGTINLQLPASMYWQMVAVVLHLVATMSMPLALSFCSVT